jgi:hypothetical protein
MVSAIKKQKKKKKKGSQQDSNPCPLATLAGALMIQLPSWLKKFMGYLPIY